MGAMQNSFGFGRDTCRCLLPAESAGSSLNERPRREDVVDLRSNVAKSVGSHGRKDVLSAAKAIGSYINKSGDTLMVMHVANASTAHALDWQLFRIYRLNGHSSFCLFSSMNLALSALAEISFKLTCGMRLAEYSHCSANIVEVDMLDQGPCLGDLLGYFVLLRKALRAMLPSRLKGLADLSDKQLRHLNRSLP